jgi:hypothetical protein
MGLSEAFYERVMANVNLKVMMRIGDNRTATDMTEWFGKITSTKKSIGAGVTTGISTAVMQGNLGGGARRTGGESQTVSYSEDEEDLVSAEELKHEMSAEKGLAWFDKGDGIVRKGRSIWFDADLPGTWEGREFLTKYESVEADEVGLAEWVDEHIFSIEEADAERESERLSGDPSPSISPQHTGDFSRDELPVEESGPFKLNLLRPFRGKNRANTMVVKNDLPPEAPAAPAGPSEVDLLIEIRDALKRG